MAETSVTFYQGTQAEYDAASTKNANGIYFLSDTQSIYKGSVKYGGGDVAIATDKKAGIVKPGSDFDVAADGTISLYQKIDVTSFTNNVNTVEKGSSITKATLRWAINKTPSSLSLVKGADKYTVAASDTSKDLTFTEPLTANATFSLTATDTRNASDTATTSITFLNGKYYGVGTVTDAAKVNDAFVQGLTKQLVSGRTGDFIVTANAGQYIYFAIPTAFGTPAFFVGGFEGGFDLFKSFSYTNSLGYAETYDVYKSTNANLGNTTVTVK